MNKLDERFVNLPARTILNKIKQVDGIGSGLDADTIDGLHANSFLKPSAFRGSLTRSGYQKLSSGLIIQWGGPVILPAHGAHVIITFPITFPNAVLHIYVTPQNAAVEQIGFYFRNNSSCILETGVNDPVSRSAHWLAIGH